MQTRYLISLLFALSLTGCAGSNNTVQTAADTAPTVSQLQETALDASNPFAHENTLPYGAPEFDKVKPEHFVPAIKAGMAQQKAEIAAIAASKDAPTFENTLSAMEKSGRLLYRAYMVFDNYSNAYTDDTIRAAEVELAPLMSAHDDEIFLNDALFKRVEALYNDRGNIDYDTESLRLLEKYYQDFVRAGAKLSPEQKEQIKSINTELSTLSAKYSQNILSEMNNSAVLVETKEELAGMSDEDIQAAAEAAKKRGQEGKYLIALKNTSIQPSLASIDNRELRKKIHMASISRGMRGNDADNRDMAARIIRLRAERAKLLGYPSHAAFKVENQCAKTVDAVNGMFNSMVPAVQEAVKREASELQAMIDKSGQSFSLEAWDWFYYAEKLRKEKYSFDESAMKPYFELNSVINNGVFYAAGKLYGLSFKKRHDLPVYDPDVHVWEVFNEDGTSVGLFYGDYYARDNKRGGAWMSEYVTQSKLTNTKPVILNQLNIIKPASGPTLISVDEVDTLFHEFGHALHGLLSDVIYPRFSGTSVPRDFVEFPSQFNETWAFHPDILPNYAKHYETGETIPAELVQKFLNAQKFNQGYMTAEHLGASMLDSAWHQYSLDTLPDISRSNFEQVEHDQLVKMNIYNPVIPPRYRTAYFNHIFASGYDAGYYAYMWAEVLDADAEDWFKTNGLSRETGQKLRDEVLSKGNSEDPMTMYKNFSGRLPSSDHLMIRKGLK